MFDKQISVIQKKLQSRPAASIVANGRTASKVPSIISADMAIRGDLVGVGDLQVEGKVFGRIDVGHLVIAEGGSVEGEVVAKAVGISGSFSGSLRASSVTLAASANVRGEILHDVLAIEAGAQLEGQCKRISLTPKDKLLSPPEETVSDVVGEPVGE
jgi:cytoskeletal protein CcmA (bactofilin family)